MSMTSWLVIASGILLRGGHSIWLGGGLSKAGSKRENTHRYNRKKTLHWRTHL